MSKAKFPALAVILLLFAIAWILSDLSILVINIPWIPIILLVVAVGMIINKYNK